MKPFFSIIIPAYNRAAFLSTALESIWKQAFQDFEVIVVNDGSTDNTAEFLKIEQQHHPNLISLNQENTERGVARNNGWRKASGSYVVFFDSDDLMHENYLESLKDLIHLHNPQIVALKFNFKIGDKIKPILNQNKLEGWHDYKLFLRGNPLACHFAVKNNFSEFVPFEENRNLATMEDWIFLLKNTVHKKLFIENKVCISMQVHQGQSMGLDQLIVNRKNLAFEEILSSISLSKREKRILKAHVLENIAIHEINLGKVYKPIIKLLRSMLLDGPTTVRIYNVFRPLKFIQNHSK